MGSYKKQDHETIKIIAFTPPEELRDDVRRSIVCSAINKAVGLYLIHNEILKT